VLFLSYKKKGERSKVFHERSCRQHNILGIAKVIDGLLYMGGTVVRLAKTRTGGLSLFG